MDISKCSKALENPASRFRILLLFCAVLFVFYACNDIPILNHKAAVPTPTPWEEYQAALDSSGLAGTRLAEAWRNAGNKALRDSIVIEAPFLEKAYFQAETPAALGYRLEIDMGEVLKVNLQTEPDSSLFFVDLFRLEPTDSAEIFRHVFNADRYQTDSLEYEVEQAGTYVLRIQPELLTSCRYDLAILLQPAYTFFPVDSKSNPDIWSVFGDPRDGGRRKHKGIDIFARRGTPVLAATDGVAHRVRERGLGGKQVWLRDGKRSQSLYYAHLDSQLVSEGARVKAGDTLGLVGNTGNARNTRPHLHFGIYRRNQGAIDPYPFVARQPDRLPSLRADLNRLGRLMRIRTTSARLQSAPKKRAPTLAKLNRDLPLLVIAASQGWYRVLTPEGVAGYLTGSSLEDADRPLQQVKISLATELLETPLREAAPVSSVQVGEEVAVLGRNGTYDLVRKTNGNMGWRALSK